MSKSALTPRRMGKRDRRRIAAIGLGPGIVVGSLRGGSEPYAAVIDEGHGVSGAIIAPTLHAKPEVVGRLESLLDRGADLGAVAEALERVAGSGDSGDVLAQIGADVERHALLAPEYESPWPGDWWFPGRRETSGFDLPISVTAPCALGHFNAGPADAPLGHLVTVYGEGCKRIAPWIGVGELMELRGRSSPQSRASPRGGSAAGCRGSDHGGGHARQPLGVAARARRGSVVTSSSGDKNNEELAFGALILAAAFLVLSPVFYAVAATATLVGSGSLPPYWEAAIGTVQIPWHLSDPAAAYGPELAASMPAGGRWWLSVGAIDGAILVGVGLCLLRVGLVVGRVRGRRRLDVRWWDPRRRLKPRAWARPRDLIHLQPRGRSGSSSAWARATGRFLRWAYRERRAPDRAGGDSWFMGRLRGAELRSVPETHLLGLAPTQAGKTTRIVIPEAIEHQGPLVVLSNKTDVLDATAESRSAVGPVWVIAPLTRLGRHGDHRRGWTPLSSCREWEGALRMGQWMFDADPAATATSTSSGGARFYNRESVSALLPPLLHAAALDGRDMATVLAWVRAGVEGLDEPREVLSEHGATAAASAVAGVQALDDRPRSLLLMSCAQLIDGYRFPSVQASDREGFDPRALLHGGTLYLVARESEQELLAPIFGGILGAILRVFEDEAADCGRPPQRPLKILADEAAHLAPLSKLPTYLAVSRSWGVRWCLLYQSVAQMQRRYGDEHQALLANTLVKVILGPIHDEATRKVVVDLLDDEATTARSHTSRSFGGNDSTTRHERHVGKASAESLRQLSEHEAIVIHGRDLPAVTTLLPWWKRRDLVG